MNRDIKEFQKRFERWKAGENYWKDIRGIDLFDDGKDDNVYDGQDGQLLRINPIYTLPGNFTVEGRPAELVTVDPTVGIGRGHFVGEETNFPIKLADNYFLQFTPYDAGIVNPEYNPNSAGYISPDVVITPWSSAKITAAENMSNEDYLNNLPLPHPIEENPGLRSIYPEFALLTGGRALATGAFRNLVDAASPYLKPGGTFWTNPLTKQTFASEFGARTWDAANVALTGNTWAQNLSKDIHRYTGWNPQESIGGQFLTEASNPFYFTPYGMVERGVNAAANGIRKALDIWNSPLTRRWTTIGNRQYRLSPITKVNAASLTPEQRIVAPADNNILTPEVNWDADYWFKTISGRSSYSAEEAAELASNVPEYRVIEKKLFDEGKLILDPSGNIKVKDSNMSPQEYIMRQSKAFQKMNPNHHYTGVSKGLRNNFENGTRDPNGRNGYDVWTDRKSPENVREYAVSREGGYIPEDSILEEEHRMLIRNENLELHKEQLEWKLKHGKISQEEYEQNIKLLERNYTEKQQKSLSVIEALKKEGRFNGGAVYDVTYPTDAVETPIINAEGAHWYSIPFENVVRDAPSVISHYPQDYNRQVASDALIMASRRNGYGVTHIDNLADSHNGELLNETIIGRYTPVKSVLGNTGNFDTTGPNKWKLYRSIIPISLIGETAYGLSNNSQKRIKSRKYKNK